MAKKTPEADVLQSGEEQENQIVIINNILPPEADPIPRVIYLHGDLTESSSGDIVQALDYFSRTPTRVIQNEDGSIKEEEQKIELFLSTLGGSAIDMLGVYDTMRRVREVCPIHTNGVGKVMSAGVLILASGTKGCRTIGENCRVMLHSVIGGYHGSLPNMEDEIQEVRWVQKRFIDLLAKETQLTKKQLKEMISKRKDVYLTAKEAVKYGIADKII